MPDQPEDRATLCRRLAAAKRAEIAALEAQHRGVRPSWVSGEIGWLTIEARRYEAEALEQSEAA